MITDELEKKENKIIERIKSENKISNKSNYGIIIVFLLCFIALLIIHIVDKNSNVLPIRNCFYISNSWRSNSYND